MFNLPISSSAPLLVAVTACLAGCGGSTLSGSVLDPSDLSFDYVQAEVVAGELVIRYLSNGTNPAPREPARLSTSSIVGSGVDVAAVPNVRVAHYVVVRTPAGELVEEPPLPDVDHGHVHFDDVGATAGHSVAGNFSLIFVNGSSLEGTFSTSISTP